MRIAFFGGTFDPIHRGHLRVASAAAGAFSLDRVLFAPVALQPLKTDTPIASFADRLKMVALALADPATRDLQPATCNFLVSSIDRPRPDGKPNYTAHTLAALALEYPAEALFVLTGADSFLDLRRWHSPERLLGLAEWIVVSRPAFALTEKRLAPLALTPAERARVHLLTTVHEDVSATQLRRSLRAGDPCAALLPPAVAAYIQAHHLYR